MDTFVDVKQSAIATIVWDSLKDRRFLDSRGDLLRRISDWSLRAQFSSGASIPTESILSVVSMCVGHRGGHYVQWASQLIGMSTDAVMAEVRMFQKEFVDAFWADDMHIQVSLSASDMLVRFAQLCARNTKKEDIRPTEAPFESLTRAYTKHLKGPKSDPAIWARKRTVLIAEIVCHPEFVEYAKPTGDTRIILDINGVFINIPYVHAHIPFGLVTDEVLRVFEMFMLLSVDDLMELRIRRAHENSDLFHYIDLVATQEQMVGGVTDAEILQLLSHSPTPIIALFDRAREFSDVLLGEQFEGRELASPQDVLREYAQVSRSIHTAYYYPVLKLMRAALDFEDTATRFCYVPFKKSPSGDLHSYLLAIDGEFGSSVLVEWEKHIHVRARALLNSKMVTIERDVFLQSEYVFTTVADMRRQLAESDVHTFARYRRSIDYFVLATNPDLYEEIQDLWAREIPDYLLLQSKYYTGITEYSLGYIQGLFARRLDLSEEKFCSVHDFTFDAEYRSFIMHYLPEAVTYFDELQLPITVRALVINELVSTHIPPHLEEYVMSKLRLHRNRPLLNIIGGARQMQTSDTQQLVLFCRAVVSTSHKYLANVSIPGTMSGLGYLLSKEIVEYRERTRDMSHHAKAHFFSVTPGGNVLLPFLETQIGGNDRMDERYIPCVVDQVFTPSIAEWGSVSVTDLRGYLTHIAYMESLYMRVAPLFPVITVICNGGLFSVCELEEVLLHNGTVLFISDSGRLGSVASLCMSHGLTHGSFSVGTLKTLMDSDLFDEWIIKDWGASVVPTTRTNELYRERFLRCLEILHQKRGLVHVATFEGSQDVLEALMGRAE